MPQVNITVDKNYIDPYTKELFDNYTKANYDRIADDISYSDQQCFEALVEDAENFIETVTSDFTGISIDYDAEQYAYNFIDSA
jgi:hypothetical protein